MGLRGWCAGAAEDRPARAVDDGRRSNRLKVVPQAASQSRSSRVCHIDPAVEADVAPAQVVRPAGARRWRALAPLDSGSLAPNAFEPSPETTEGQEHVTQCSSRSVMARFSLCGRCVCRTGPAARVTLLYKSECARAIVTLSGHQALGTTRGFPGKTQGTRKELATLSCVQPIDPPAGTLGLARDARGRGMIKARPGSTRNRPIRGQRLLQVGRGTAR